MRPDDPSFFDTAMSVVARYGMKRTTMDDLSRAAGVSRQTLYDRFGDKDGVMAAVIDHMATRLCKELQAAFDARRDLTDKLDAYFEIAVWPTYALMQAMPDALDFEKGMGPASIAASRQGSERKQAILADMLDPYFATGAHAPASVAAFVEQASSRAKVSNITKEELDRFLVVLKASTAALANRA